MTVEDIVQETRDWPRNKVSDLIQALTVNAQSAQTIESDFHANAEKRFREFAKRIEEIWAGTDVQHSNEDIVNIIRQSRGDRA